MGKFPASLSQCLARGFAVGSIQKAKQTAEGVQPQQERRCLAIFRQQSQRVTLCCRDMVDHVESRPTRKAEIEEPEKTSKSFRASFLKLQDVQLQRLQHWAKTNCAAGDLLQEDDCVVSHATRERAKTQEAFLWSVCATLKRLEINMSALKCWWLSLTTKEVVRAQAAGQAAATIPVRTIKAAVWRTWTESPPDDNERTIVLPGQCRGAALVTSV